MELELSTTPTSSGSTAEPTSAPLNDRSGPRKAAPWTTSTLSFASSEKHPGFPEKLNTSAVPTRASVPAQQGVSTGPPTIVNVEGLVAQLMAIPAWLMMTEVKRASFMIELLLAQGPRPRVFLEAVLVHEGRLSARSVTHALKALCNSGAILLTEIGEHGSSGQLRHLYSHGLAHQDAIRDFERAFEMKDKLFDTELLGDLGELYIHSLLKNTKLFKDLGLPRDLGKHREVADGALNDVFATYRDDPYEIGKLTFEVKNTREVFYPSDDVLEQVVDNGLRQRRQPVLVVPFLSDELKQVCARTGVGVFELGRQLIPAGWRNELEALRIVIGPQPIEYVAGIEGKRQRLFKCGLSAAAQRDCEMVGDPRLLLGASQAWKRNKHEIEVLGFRPWLERSVRTERRQGMLLAA